MISLRKDLRPLVQLVFPQRNRQGFYKWSDERNDIYTVTCVEYAHSSQITARPVTTGCTPCWALHHPSVVSRLQSVSESAQQRHTLFPLSTWAEGPRGGPYPKVYRLSCPAMFLSFFKDMFVTYRIVYVNLNVTSSSAMGSKETY